MEESTWSEKILNILGLRESEGASLAASGLKGAVVNLMALTLFATLVFWIILIIFFYRKPFPVVLFVILVIGLIIYKWLQTVKDAELRARVFVNVMAALVLVVNFSCVIDYGVVNTNTPWLLAIPIVSFFLGGINLGLAWTLIVVSYLLALVLLGQYGLVQLRDFEEVVDLFSSYFIISLFSLLFEVVRARFKRRIVRKNLELQKFVYVVSHDLRSPLTSSRGYLDEVKRALREGRTERVEEDLDKLDTLMKDMGKMIDELLVLSRLSKEKYQKKRLNVGVLVEEVLENFQIQFQEKNFQVELKSEFPELSVYERPLREVFSNLISNAIKFSGEKDQPRIEIGYVCEAGEERFYVKDNGIGIPEEERQQLFGLFYRRGNRAGSGIGLSVVKEYVEMHGGRVWVVSEEGKGSTFWFSLPAGEE